MSIFNDPLLKTIHDLKQLTKDFTRLRASLHSPFPVLNENTPTQLVASVNDYEPGDYAVLRMSSDASRTITGIASGKKGRELKILNVGAQNIVLAHQSVSSAVANRIISPTGANITLGANDSATLYYDSTSLLWRFVAIVQ